MLTVLGAVIGAAATLAAAHYTSRRQSFNAAAANFRAAFVPTICMLRKADQDVYRIITDDVLAEQERALVVFEPFLSKSARKELGYAWQQYSKGPHTESPGSLDRRPVDIERAQSNIALLMKRASPK